MLFPSTWKLESEDLIIKSEKEDGWMDKFSPYEILFSM